MTAQFLVIIAGVPLCATVAGLIVWILHRKAELEDTELQRNFLIVFTICFGLGWAVLRSDTVRMKLDPAFRIKAEIKANALFKTINEIDESGTGNSLRRALEEEMHAGATLSEALARARPLLSEAARQRVNFADQQTRLMWAGYVVDTLKELQPLDPEKCYYMSAGAPLDPRGVALSAKNTEAFYAALIRLYESSLKRMRREHSSTDVPTKFEEGQREFAVIKEELTNRYGPEVALAVTSRTHENLPASAATMCSARIFQLESILKRPQGVAAMLAGNALR